MYEQKPHIGTDIMRKVIINMREEMKKMGSIKDLLGMIHYSGKVSDADRRCASPYDIATETVEEIRAIKNKIDTDNRRS